MPSSVTSGTMVCRHISPAVKKSPVIGVVGDKTKLSEENLLSYNEVEKIVPVTESYKLVNRKSSSGSDDRLYRCTERCRRSQVPLHRG
jgi:hypothetical protein